MPIYEYICKKCQRFFEAIVLGSKKPECPFCKSKSLEKQFSLFAKKGSSGSSSGSATSSRSCGGRCRPGCSCG